MYDLAAFRDRIAALYRRADPYGDGHRPTQQDLAEAVGLSRTELSRRLNGLQHARLTSRDVHAIVQTLAEWEAISAQAEARELLALLDCPDFTPAEWQSPPLDELIPSSTIAPSSIPQSSTLSPQHSNLPRPATSFIGREQELPEVASLISTRRLVTLTGPGGVGKTRLALEVVNRMAGGFGDGIYWVELASVRDPLNVAPAIAAALDVEEQAGEALDETLRRHLQHKDTLLLLDNCEHLAAAVSMLARDLLAGCPRLHIFATSREPLRLSKEARYSLSPLPLPPPDIGLSVERIADFAAVQLFVARATAARDSFHLTVENVAAVHYICTQLDGLPLALELAAARVQLMTAIQITAQLAERFRLLTNRHRDVDPRHQTLTALLDWSYGLLTAEEQAVFRTLAIFSGGFTLEAVAAAMNATPLDVLDLLSELLNKSLIQPAAARPAAEATDAPPRFTMLETVREYALLKLREAGEEQAARQAHAAYYRQLAEQVAPELAGSQQSVWLARLEQDYPNLSAAVGWSLKHEDDAAAALQISGGLWRFWQAHGPVSETRQWLDRALARSTTATPALTAEAMDTAGRLAYLQADFPAARQHLEAALALHRELADERGSASALNNLGAVAAAQGDYQFARQSYEQGLTVMRRLNNKVGVGISLHNLGLVTASLGDYRAARALFEQALAVRRELGNDLAIALTLTALGDTAYDQDDYATAAAFYQEAFTLFQAGGDKWQLSYTLTNMGKIATALGDYDRALLLHRQGLQLHEEMGDQLGVINFIEGMALLAQAKQQPERATRLWGAASALREAIKSAMFASDRPRHERSIAHLRSALGNAAFARAWVAGQIMNMEQAVAYALSYSEALPSDEVTFP